MIVYAPHKFDRGRRASLTNPALASYEPFRGPAETLPRPVNTKVILSGMAQTPALPPAPSYVLAMDPVTRIQNPRDGMPVRIAYGGNAPTPEGAAGTVNTPTPSPSTPASWWNPNAPVSIAPTGSGPAANFAGELANRQAEHAAYQQYEDQQAIAENASVLATNPSLATTAGTPLSAVPLASVPASTVIPTGQVAPATTDWFSELTTWFEQQSLIPGIPNWAIAVGVTGMLAVIYSRGRR